MLGRHDRDADRYYTALLACWIVLIQVGLFLLVLTALSNLLFSPYLWGLVGLFLFGLLLEYLRWADVLAFARAVREHFQKREPKPKIKYRLKVKPYLGPDDPVQ